MAPRDAEGVGNLAQWDTYGPETPGSHEAVFFFDLAADAAGQTRALLHDAASEQGVSLKFNKNQLPCFSLWKNRQAAADGYVTGLEPAINFPNRKSFEKEKGRVAILAPGESRTFEVTDRGSSRCRQRRGGRTSGGDHPTGGKAQDPPAAGPGVVAGLRGCPKNLPSPFGRGAGGEGMGRAAKTWNSSRRRSALTLTQVRQPRAIWGDSRHI